MYWSGRREEGESIWRSARNLEGGGRDDAESMSRIISGVLSIYSLWGEDENKISTREREMKWTFENIPIPLSLRGGQALRNRVQDSGAVHLSEVDITILADDTLSDAGAITKERVAYVSSGVLDKLVVNVLLVVFVP